MDLLRALSADLHDLAVDLSAGGYTQLTLDLLHNTLRRCIPSILGASLSLTLDDVADSFRLDLVVRTVHPEEIRSSVRLRLTGTAQGYQGWIDLFAHQPQAFDGMRADLTRRAMSPFPIHPAGPQLAPDEHEAQMPLVPLQPKLHGLVDFTLVNRALGILLNRGYPLQAARDELLRRAVERHTSLSSAAAALLAEC